jgi:uncharacterized protein
MLNASWFKVLTFFGVWTAIWLPIALLISQFIDWQPSEPLTPKQKLIFLASLYLLVPIVIEWKLKAESLSFASLGIAIISNAIWYTILGLCLGFGSIIITFGLESALDLVDWRWQNIKGLLPLFLPILILSLLISLIEELVFRGYIFITLLSDNSLWIAAVISSLIFALLHLVWERTQTLPQIPGLWLMGIVLVVARILGGNTIYLPLGLHAGWIWGLTCIDSVELIAYKHKNHWLTGINQQPLAGVAGIFCLMFTCLAISSIAQGRL